MCRCVDRFQWSSATATSSTACLLRGIWFWSTEPISCPVHVQLPHFPSSGADTALLSVLFCFCITSCIVIVKVTSSSAVFFIFRHVPILPVLSAACHSQTYISVALLCVNLGLCLYWLAFADKISTVFVLWCVILMSRFIFKVTVIHWCSSYNPSSVVVWRFP